MRGVHVSPEEAAPLGELGGYEYALSVEDGAGLDCVEFMLAAGETNITPCNIHAAHALRNTSCIWR